MKRTLPFLFALLLFFPGAVCGQTIQLKYSFPDGWSYSTDSLHFRGLGPGASLLKGEMFGDTAALAGLDSYVNQQAVSDVTAVVGVCLLGGSM